MEGKSELEIRSSELKHGESAKKRIRRVFFDPYDRMARRQ